MAGRRGWGWAGPVSGFLATDDDAILTALEAHHRALLNMPTSSDAQRAWQEELTILRAALRRLHEADEGIGSWSVVFEYELPLEGGRRPDVVLLTHGRVIVLEFKSTMTPSLAQLDQVEAYARDLSEYHEATHGVPVDPVLVLARSAAAPRVVHGVPVTGGGSVHKVLGEHAGDGTPLDLDAWLNANYAPLPTLIAAARRIFEHEPLPRIRRAESAHIPETVELLRTLAQEAEGERKRVLVLLGGVPGSGKTLAGLSLVYAQGGLEADATFLSGNGPLVRVLQDALSSRVFVKDLHKFITDYGEKEKQPQHHVVVFDEAQRMWDARYMKEKRGLEASEPDLLIRAGERVGDWAALVGLIGEGQEIYVGEEGGLGLWEEAILKSEDDWEVYGPPGTEEVFQQLEVETLDLLELTVPLRSRRAEALYRWVHLLLEGSLELAARQAEHVQSVGFPIYVTRDIEQAKAYARERYAEDPDPRYGLLVSSHPDRKHAKKRDLDVTFYTMQRINRRVANWFNAPPDDPESCCQLVQPLTEFQVQGLEIDLPIVVWGEDYLWQDGEWELDPKRRRAHVDDPEQLLQNVYRVLLTRGRDGLVIVVPEDPAFDETAEALTRAGARDMPDEGEADLAAEPRVSYQSNGTE